MDLSGVIAIARPIDEVFAAWAALERAPEHAEGIVERRSLEDRPIAKGATFEAVDRWLGRTVRYTIEVTAYEPPGRLAVTCSAPLDGGWDVILEEVGGLTELRFEATIEPSGLLGLVAPLMAPVAARRTRRRLASFKAWVENGPPATGSGPDP